MKKIVCAVLCMVLMLSMCFFASAVTYIPVIEIIDIAAPVAGEKADYSATLRTSGYTKDSGGNNMNYYKNGIGWYNVTDGKNHAVTANIEAGDTYKVMIILSANDGYAFSNGVSATVNGKTARVNDLGNGFVEVSYEFLMINDIYVVIEEPVVGAKYPYFAMVGSSSYKLGGGNNPNYYNNGIGWYSVTDSKNLQVGGRFESEKQYKVILNVQANGNYSFAPGVTARVGNHNAEVTYINEQIVQVEYTYSKLPGNSFVDVKKQDYFYTPVLWALSAGVTSGLDATHFGPNANCTRAQAVAFLWRAAGSPAPHTTQNPFTDVAKGSYYYEAVLWATEYSIVAGTSNTTFSPNAPCTRGQIVTFLWRAAGEKKENVLNPFNDVKKNDYYYDAVLWAVKNNITAGITPERFSPADKCTRGQIVTFLYRATVE